MIGSKTTKSLNFISVKTQIPLGTYQHYKGPLYEIIGVARHSETLEELVVYLDHKKDLWVRPLEMFLENVEIEGKCVPRFKFVGE